MARYVSLLPSHQKVKSLPLLLPNNVVFDSTNFTISSNGEERKSLYLVPFTRDVLSKVKQKIGSISVVGPTRSGKSYLLSMLLGSKNAFALGHTVKACTFGIWIATTAIDKGDHLVILLDTEGIDHVDAQHSTDVPLIVYSLLMSSLFVYNSSGVPKQEDLKNMNYFTKVATMVRVNSTTTEVDDDEQEDPNELRQHMPHFHWVLRDQLLQIVVQGKEVSFQEYLIDMLKTDSHKTTPTALIKRAILTLFPKITASALPPPSSEEEVVRSMDIVEESKLNPKFLPEVQKCSKELLDMVKPKTFVSGKSQMINMTGETFVAMTTLFLKPLNDPNAIWNIGTTWPETVKIIVNQKIEELCTEYCTLMAEFSKANFPCDEAVLMATHRKIQQIVHEKLITVLKTYSVGKEEAQNLLDKLAVWERIENSNSNDTKAELLKGGLFYPFFTDNFEKSKKFCLAAGEQIYQTLMNTITADGYNWDKLQNDIDALLQRYNEMVKGKGPAKAKVWSENYERWMSEIQHLQNLSNEKRERVRIEMESRKKAAEFTNTLIEKEQQMENYRNNMEAKQTQLEQQFQLEKENFVRVSKEIEEKHAADLKKIQDNVIAQSEFDRKAMMEFQKQQQETLTGLMQQMQQQAQQQQQSIVELVTALKNMPPPQVHVDGGGGDCVLC